MPRQVWEDEFYVESYLHARAGLSNQKIADALGVSYSTFKFWYRERRALREAIELGRSPNANGKAQGERFLDYCYKRLPPDLQEVWDKLNRFRRETNLERSVEAMLEDQGKNARQVLFVHAMVNYSWNVSEACRIVNISRECYEKWRREDPDFVKLLASIEQSQKDFIEGRLMDRVWAGDTQAIIFASKTKNRDRGYDPKLVVEHVGGVLHAHVDIDRIMGHLSIEAQREVLAALRKAKAEDQAALPAHRPDEPGGVVEAEVLNVSRH